MTDRGGGSLVGTVVGLVLAAGAGRRFGGPKALALLDGERLVDRTVTLLRDGGCDRVLVVAGAAPLEIVGATVVENPAWQTGMGSSLRAGLAAAAGSPAGAGAAVVVPVDAPWLDQEAVRRVIAAWRAGAAVASATYGGRRGHPVLLGAAHWDGVAAAAVGELGARAYLGAHPELVTEVPCDGAGRPDDVDTPADLERGAGADRGSA